MTITWQSAKSGSPEIRAGESPAPPLKTLRVRGWRRRFACANTNQSYHRGTRGSALVEAALFIPILSLLLFGTLELARIGWTFFTLEKMMNQIARDAGVQQGINFCDPADPQLANILNYATTVTEDGSGTPILPNLTATNISVRVERVDPTTSALGVCDCSITGCDLSAGGRSPDFIVVYLPDGYTVSPRLPFMAAITPFLLRPHVRMPFGGT